MPKKKVAPPAQEVSELLQLRAQLTELTERERRLQADYQNIVRRTREDKLAHSKLATKQVMSDLLDPLTHLSLANKQIKDAGLTMVIDQLWKVLANHGLEKLDVLGQQFDPTTMEAVESSTTSDTAVVSSVIQPGYALHGELIQHAKVVVS
ncbi:MAG: nucleotide exchange factor GrpE [Candidatus Pacebacteria bacterium CG10_big_fil_rev_8_21_14_0_10_44_54]|nr:MAG: nucleotide exchange factor GrpE [Candidatus Pacebacteria bacterium CG10_big_fil_rev_8_21_14_0_10_44_54]